jgi:hypothetical protein
MNRSVDRLCLVSKLLLDQRVLDLRKENEDLRAWNVYGPKELTLWMPSVNQVYMDEVCTCKSCFMQGRLDMGHLLKRPQHPSAHPFVRDGWNGLKEMEKCIIKKCLVLQVLGLGLRVLEQDISYPRATRDPTELDCHIVLMINGYEWRIAYGSRFSQTNFHMNPDLEKLKILFELCRDGNDFFRVGDVDYSD